MNQLINHDELAIAHMYHGQKTGNLPPSKLRKSSWQCFGQPIRGLVLVWVDWFISSFPTIQLGAKHFGGSYILLTRSNQGILWLSEQSHHTGKVSFSDFIECEVIMTRNLSV